MAAVNVKRGDTMDPQYSKTIWWCALIRDRDRDSVQLEEKQITCSWRAVWLFGVVTTAVEVHGVTVVAGKSIASYYIHVASFIE